MIKINKSKIPVSIPYANGNVGECRLINAAQNVMDKYNGSRRRYNQGEKQFSFYGEIYGHKLVRQAIMVSAQRNKCCYCEKSIIDDETVEHFRPKKGYKQDRGQAVMKPGYYWLAYDWSNLFYACYKCNQSKENLFPLMNPGARVKNHRISLTCRVERPLLINPALDNPSPYFKFIGATIKEVNSKNYIKKRKSITTIDVVDLNREGLFEKRAAYHMEILAKKAAYYASYSKTIARREFKAFLLTKISADQEFSLMVKSVFSNDLR
jgi:uncharacterized protein (TIGR02646 family)